MTADKIREHCTREAIRIWNEHAVAHTHRPGATKKPMLREHYTVNAEVLFVGMNPSFSEDAVDKIANAMGDEGARMKSALSWSKELVDDGHHQQLLDVAKFESKAKEVHIKYFKPLDDFRQRVNAASHCHLDLLLLRHTIQKSVLQAYGEGYRQLSSVPFISEQIELFRWTLKAMSPKVVIVANAKASEIAVDALPLESLDSGRTYWWAEMPGVPFFLSGMLSGQRALDTHSRKRLELDVKAALEVARKSCRPE